VSLTTLSRKQVLSRGRARLLGAGVGVERREIEWMFMEASNCSMVDLTVYPEAEVSPGDQTCFDEMLNRRIAGEPLQYILGYTDFMGLRITVRPGVLIPRPETEGLVSTAVEQLQGMSNPVVLDVGTGSGCIALAVKSACPGARVIALDISEKALQIARSNARLLGLDIHVIRADLMDPATLENRVGEVDLILSNPPYIPAGEAIRMDRNVLDYEPNRALFAGPDGLDTYDPLCKMGTRLLKSAGWLMVEIHEEHGADVRRIFKRNTFSRVMVTKDLAGRDRYVIGQKGTGHGS